MTLHVPGLSATEQQQSQQSIHLGKITKGAKDNGLTIQGGKVALNLYSVEIRIALLKIIQNRIELLQ